MIGRVAVLLMVMLTLMVGVPALAQYPAQQPQPPTNPGYPTGVSPASYAAGAWGGPSNSNGGPVIHERMLSQDRGWGYRDTHLDRILDSVVRNSWIRLDYLLFETRRPGDHILGADDPMVDNERFPFNVSAGGTVIGQATVPAIDNISLKNINGMRGTVGLMLNEGSLEANVWGLKENSAKMVMNGLGAQGFGTTAAGGPPPDPVFAATTVNKFGEPLGGEAFLYDHSFGARYVQDVWGTGINYIRNDANVGEGFRMMPMLGFRYLEVNEGLFQTGVFNGGFDGVVDFGEDLNSNGVMDVGEDINNDGLLDLGLVSVINSRVNNEIFAPQIGMRFQLQHRWFTLGFEPKVALGGNRYQMEVETDQLRSFGDPLTKSSSSGWKEAMIMDFRFYLKLFPSEDIEFFLSYDITVAQNVSRAYDNIYYNDNGQSEPPAIGVDPGFERVWWQGLVLGGQIWLR